MGPYQPPYGPGYRRRSLLEQILSGLISGAGAFGQGLQQSQDRQRQKELHDQQKQLNDLNIQRAKLDVTNAQKAAKDAETASYLQSIDRAEQNFPSPEDFSVLEQRRGDILTGKLKPGPYTQPGYQRTISSTPQAPAAAPSLKSAFGTETGGAGLGGAPVGPDLGADLGARETKSPFGFQPSAPPKTMASLLAEGALSPDLSTQINVPATASSPLAGITLHRPHYQIQADLQTAARTQEGADTLARELAVEKQRHADALELATLNNKGRVDVAGMRTRAANPNDAFAKIYMQELSKLRTQTQLPEDQISEAALANAAAAMRVISPGTAPPAPPTPPSVNQTITGSPTTPQRPRASDLLKTAFDQATASGGYPGGSTLLAKSQPEGIPLPWTGSAPAGSDLGADLSGRMTGSDYGLRSAGPPKSMADLLSAGALSPDISVQEGPAPPGATGPNTIGAANIALKGAQGAAATMNANTRADLARTIAGRLQLGWANLGNAKARTQIARDAATSIDNYRTTMAAIHQQAANTGDARTAETVRHDTAMEGLKSRDPQVRSQAEVDLRALLPNYRSQIHSILAQRAQQGGKLDEGQLAELHSVQGRLNEATARLDTASRGGAGTGTGAAPQAPSSRGGRATAGHGEIRLFSDGKRQWDTSAGKWVPVK